MKNKKILSLIMCSVMFLNMPKNVLGLEINKGTTKLENISEAEFSKNNIDPAKVTAQSLMKDLFQLELGEPNKVEFNSYQDGNDKNYKWSMFWNISNNDKNQDISLVMDALSGRVLNLSNYEYSNNVSDQNNNKITKDQCRKSADEFFMKINPGGFKESEFFIDTYTNGRGKYVNQNLNFKYIRKVNGLRFQDNFVNIEINTLTGKVISYNCNWTSNLEFPANSNVIGNSRAMEIFQDNIKLQKNYIFEKDKDGVATNKLKLVYMCNFNGEYNINVRTGEIIDWNNNKLVGAKLKDISKNKLQNLIKNSKNIASNDFQIDENRAWVIINSYMKEIYGPNCDLEKVKYSDNINSNEYNKKMWVGEFVDKNNNHNEYSIKGIVAIDPYTEGLIYCEKSNYINESDKFQAKYNWGQLYDRAIEVVAKYFPDKLEKIKTEQTYIKDKEKERYANFSFSRKINDIDFPENNIKVSFDLQTGNIISIQSKWKDNISISKNEDMVSEEEAKKIYFDNNKAEQIYYLYNNINGAKKDEVNVGLAYSLSPIKGNYIKYVDSASGRLLSADGREVDNSNEEFSEKIKDNKYEKEFNMLAQEGIIDSKNFRMYKDITLIDLIKMLINTKGYRPDVFKEMDKLKFTNIYESNPDYKYIQLAVKYGMIENKEIALNLNEKISREKMAKYIVKFIKYDKLADNKNIFNLKVKDINDVEEIGYVAIAKGLGILTVENDKIRAKDKATMLEACVGIYNVLDNIRTSNK